MKILTIDLHIGVRDFQTIARRLGHQCDVICMSNHAVFGGYQKESLPHYNQETWKNLNTEMCVRFHQEMSGLLREYDCFYCFYPPSSALLYRWTEKPIIVHSPIRYETPFTFDPRRWAAFNHYLSSPKITLLANSAYDMAYTEYYTGLACGLAPSLCDYYGAKYSPSKDTFLLYSKIKMEMGNTTWEGDVKGRSFEETCSYRGVIWLPYSPSIMSFFEHYAAGIPLFVPSKKFLIELRCLFPEHIMSECSFAEMENRSAAFHPGGDDPNALSKFDYWFSLCDWYQEDMPHLIYFDSFEDLVQKLKTTNLRKTSQSMLLRGVDRKKEILTKWKAILSKIERKIHEENPNNRRHQSTSKIRPVKR